ncbi:MAG: cache domain-containing protein [Methanocorpusculum sp.]|uniref:cache domain-containing protein n=1 Tax=Methanocorpusculum sp. TaxID=2058474 RepID=UPI00271BB3AC|nr:cache domain-containing protein [Methanocorpusculum sp.]MDO9523590.1 cache domain-containing protein [Methanocorpusculum sp.]
MIRHAFSKIVFIIIVLLFISASGCINFIPETENLEPVTDEYYTEMDTVLYPYIQTIDDEMKTMTATVWNAARELDGVPADDPAVALALLKLKSEIPLSYEVGRVDTENILTAITGDVNNQQLIGTEIITTPYTEEELRVAGPDCLISEYVTFQNGDRGIKIIAPVYDAEGNFDGTLQAAFDVGYLFSGTVEKLRSEYGYTVWVTQDNGVVIYDEDTPQIGGDLTTQSSEYTPSFAEAAADILNNESGHASYIFYRPGSHIISQTNAVWETVDPGYGATWRVVLVDNLPLPHETTELTVTQEELKAFVSNAYIYANTEGKEKAIAAFNDPNGEFIDGELYIFAGDMNGTILSVPYQPALVGRNAWFTEDANGVKFVQRTIARAEQGGGYVLYLYTNPNQDYSRELKLSYVLPIDNEWYIGAGMYVHNTSFSHTVNVDWQTRNALIQQVRTMRYLAAVDGIPAVTEMMMDPNSEFQREGLYPFAVTGNGTILAFSQDPALVGTNQLGSVNSYGMSFVREGISLGEAGGGLMYTLAWDSVKQKEVFVLDYVEPVGNDTYFASYMILE